MNQDEQQNIFLAEVKRDIHYMKQTMQRHEQCFKTAMEKYEKVAEVERAKCETRVSDMIRSFNNQADNWKQACDAKFVTKEKANPVISLFEKGKNKLASLGLVIIILLGMIGLATTGVLHSIKDKLLR